jgi:hypothetical protein
VEIELVNLEIGSPFALVPFKLHRQIVYTVRVNVKSMQTIAGAPLPGSIAKTQGPGNGDQFGGNELFGNNFSL